MYQRNEIIPQEVHAVTNIYTVTAAATTTFMFAPKNGQSLIDLFDSKRMKSSISLHGTRL
jgi:hypothetical protein